jgi:hypothetical protein
MRWQVVVALAALGSACGGAMANQPGPDERYEAMCRTWVSHQVSEVIARWGLPSQVLSLPDGTITYQWDTVRGRLVAPEEAARLGELQQAAGAWCSTRLVARRDGTIRSYGWNGMDHTTTSYETVIGCQAD